MTEHQRPPLPDHVKGDPLPDLLDDNSFAFSDSFDRPQLDRLEELQEKMEAVGEDKEAARRFYEELNGG